MSPFYKLPSVWLTLNEDNYGKTLKEKVEAYLFDFLAGTQSQSKVVSLIFQRSGVLLF